MEKHCFTVLAFVLVSINLIAAPVNFLPTFVIQPDGDTINCFISGDEYYRWIHDEEGYTFLQGEDGYFYYAEKKDNRLVPSKYKVSTVDPKSVKLEKWLIISSDEYIKLRETQILNEKRIAENYSSNSRISEESKREIWYDGTINNIVIYIRFAQEDNADFNNPRGYFDEVLNTGSLSLKSYFEEVSYQKLSIVSSHFPKYEIQNQSNLSYQDSHTRGYFEIYDETTNPEGYKDSNERYAREHQLMDDAINWLNLNNQFPSEVDFDLNNDGFIDVITFVYVYKNILLNQDQAFGSILWPHAGSYTSKQMIRGKKVSAYIFVYDIADYVTFSHEMFHTLLAPDLYTLDDKRPIGRWDIMSRGTSHMGAYMKWKYSNGSWIESIPEITEPGTYKLNPLTSSTNNCFKIQSFSEAEYFIVEYRKKVGQFESKLPGEGLLVYRINPDARSNLGLENEVYIYRPDGTLTQNGQIDEANFSLDFNRTSITDETNPHSFLKDGSPGGLKITNITNAGNTISFDFDFADAAALTLDSAFNSFSLTDSILYFSLKAHNKGNLASGNFETTLFLSEDVQIDTNDLVLSKQSLSIDRSKSQEINFSVRLDSILNKIGIGKFYIGYIIDTKKEVSEYDENDNIYCYDNFTFLNQSICSSDSFFVGNSYFSESGIYNIKLENTNLNDSVVFLNLISYHDSICGPDLIISDAITTEFITGSGDEYLSLEYKIKNVGKINAEFDGPTDSYLDNILVLTYLSADTILQNGRDKRTFGGVTLTGLLAPGDSITIKNILLKSNSVEADSVEKYRFKLIVLDVYDKLAELNESNNLYYLWRDSLILTSTDSLIFNKNVGQEKSLSIKSNVQWALSSDAKWISFEPKQGKLNLDVRVSTQNENSSSEPRIDSIKIESQGTYDKFIKIIQKCEVVSSIDTLVCNSIEIGDTVLTKSGDYRLFETSQQGCDSIIYLSLKVVPPVEQNITASICAGEKYQFAGRDLTNSGQYFETFQSTMGCDSLVTLNLTTNPTYEKTVSAEICQGETYHFGEEELSSSGTYEKTFTSATSCDSLVTLNLTTNPSYEKTISAEICQGETYNFGEEELSSSGTYEKSFTAATGCDSLVTLNLTTNPIYESSISTEICQGETYHFGEEELSSSGTYEKTFTAATGCDSLVTLNLTTNPIYESSISAEICQGKTYHFGDEELSSSGTYEKTFTSATGCDSLVTLNLTTNPSYENNISAQICEGETYSFAGIELSETGNYSEAFKSKTGCDSIISLTLTVVKINRMLLLEGNTISSSEVDAAFQWLSCSEGDIELLQDKISFELIVEEAGEYAVRIDKYGCVEISDCITVDPIPMALGDDDVSSQISVYPIPFDDLLSISLPASEMVDIRILSVSGSTIYSEEISAPDGIIELVTKDILKGLYILVLELKEGQVFKHSVIKN